MSGLYFGSSSPEGLLDVLNALTLLQITFAASVYVYDIRRMESVRWWKERTNVLYI